MIYLLDTSALLAHFREESGWEQVEDLLGTQTATVCVVSWLEFRIRLAALTLPQKEISEVLTIYEGLWTHMWPVDRLSVEFAWALREAVKPRIPLADCLIAGCAKRHGVTLVHRDAHLATIPAHLLPSISLPVVPGKEWPQIREKAVGYSVGKRKRKA